MRNSFLTIFVAFLLVAGAKAQTTVLKYTPGVTTDGVVYYMPLTVFKVSITATRTTKHPGDFHNYAQRFLRINDVVKTEETAWKIDKVDVVATSVPDTAKAHIVLLKKGTSAPLCTLNDNGILLAINAQTPKFVEPETKDIKAASTEKVNSRDFLNEEILAAGSELKMAELTAAEIYNIRESRSELTKGEADYMPKDGEQLKLMLSKLDEQEHALLQLFKGYSDTETKTWTIYYTPQHGVSREVVARFSDQAGLVDKEDLSGAPIYIEVENKNTVPHGRTELTDKKLAGRVVYFNVPSQAVVKLLFNGEEFYRKQTPVAQFGREDYLSDDLFNKRATCKVWFNPVTGAIDKIEDDSLKK